MIPSTRLNRGKFLNGLDEALPTVAPSLPIKRQTDEAMKGVRDSGDGRTDCLVNPHADKLRVAGLFNEAP